jgi:ATP-dependent helicase/nuclease subunit A
LVDQTTGWILVDRKSAPFAFQDWDRFAENHGGQLDAYAQAVEKTAGRPVLEKWL